MRLREPYFLFSLWTLLWTIVLVLNDRVLKLLAPGHFVTGKLSDVAGLVLLTALLDCGLRVVFALPRRQAATTAVVLSAAAIAIVKLSPHALHVFDALHQAAFDALGTGWHVATDPDASDLFACLVLPFARAACINAGLRSTASSRGAAAAPLPS